MPTKRQQRSKAAAVRKAPRRKPTIPTDDQLEARRERVRELFGKSDRHIARILIKEGYFAKPANGRVAVDVAKWEDSCRRTVNNDRAAIREEWKTRRRLTGGEAVTVEEYVARLRTRIADLEDMLEDPNLKSTPRVQAFGEIRQLEALIGKALGLESSAPHDPEADKPAIPFVGLVLDVSKVSGGSGS